MREVTATIDEHRLVNRQDFLAHDIIWFKTNRAIGQAARPQAKWSGIVKGGIRKELKNEAARNRLEISVQPIREIHVPSLGLEDELARDMNRRDSELPRDQRLATGLEFGGDPPGSDRALGVSF